MPGLLKEVIMGHANLLDCRWALDNHVLSPTQLKSAEVMNPCGFVSSQSDGHQIPTS